MSNLIEVIPGRRKIRFPDLICLGAQKAATTWLYDNLRHRQGVFLPQIKELHYFSQLYNRDAANYGPLHRKQQARQLEDFLLAAPQSVQAKFSHENILHLAQSDVDDQWYAKIFSDAPLDSVCVEICPSYLNMPLAAVQHLLRLNPSVRLLVVVRDPIDRCWSQIRMHISQGILERDTSRLEDETLSLFPYLFYTDYKSSLTRWRAYAQADQLKIVLYDDILEDSGKILKDLFRFTGVCSPFNENMPNRSVFKGEDMEIPNAVRARLLAALEPQYEYLRTDYPVVTEKWLTRHARALQG